MGIALSNGHCLTDFKIFQLLNFPHLCCKIAAKRDVPETD